MKNRFSGPNPQGKNNIFEENLGKVTIVDFLGFMVWTCRQENPNVVAIYKELC
jgi:hypothetical protein